VSSGVNHPGQFSARITPKIWSTFGAQQHVNEAKSAVDRPWKRKFLGFSFTARRPYRRRVSEVAIERFKERVRRLTSRTRGVSVRSVVQELKAYLVGWIGYLGFSQTRTLFRELDKWIVRRLRCYLWKQWGRGRYRQLRKLGVSRDLAWNSGSPPMAPGV